MDGHSYALVTAAYNEEAFIERTIQSVILQSEQPQRWVIVSDASTDRTDEIVGQYSLQYSFIRLVRLGGDHPRNFAAQVHAINAGYAALGDICYDYVGNLDADITFEPTYYNRLLAKFDEAPSLGLAGGTIHEQYNGTFKSRKRNDPCSVPHAIQLFRRVCYEQIGGYRALPYGGPDTYAEVLARMKGWEVRMFPELPVYHHRYTASAGGFLRGRFRQGLADFSVGAHPLFEIVKCTSRVCERPFLLGSAVRLAGFLYSYCHREERQVPEEFVRYLRTEQMAKLRGLFGVRRPTYC